jgi:uncharacterized protein YqcC (DUF446 family)
MRDLLEAKAPLPKKCEIATMAETVWSGNSQAVTVIAVLRAFDEMITAN